MQAVKKIDGLLFKSLIMNGAENLRLHYQYVDELNVFPVPDGDTGTNMLLTIEGGVGEIANLESDNAYEVARRLSRGMLMGARGNSGVILSQLFRGIYKGLEGYQTITAPVMAKAFQSGVQQAYKAVVKPVEGTILTVARESAEHVDQIVTAKTTITELFEELVTSAEASLKRTPDILPVLKDANVVDSGGAGLFYIYEGMLKALRGELLSISQVGTGHGVDFHVEHDDHEGQYGYCTEFIIVLDEKHQLNKNFDERIVTEALTPLGDSMVVVCDEDLLKVHIHSQRPGDVLNVAQQFGEFKKLKIENMQEQHNELQLLKDDHIANGNGKRPKERKKYAIVTVAVGSGLINAFHEMGTDFVVSGGQSMNPSTEDFIKAYEHVNADNIIVFPNNKNIVMAAEQSAKIYKDSKIWVVPSYTIAQGFSALTIIDLENEPEAIIEELTEQINRVTTCQITYSIRDANVDGVKITKGDYMGIVNNKIVYASSNCLDTLKAVLKNAMSSDKELITLIYGKDAHERDINAIKKFIEKNLAVELDVIEGNQEIYSYIIAVE